jgi:hypothetical protein
MAAGELSHRLGSSRHLHHLDDITVSPFLASDEPCAAMAAVARRGARCSDVADSSITDEKLTVVG